MGYLRPFWLLCIEGNDGRHVTSTCHLPFLNALRLDQKAIT
jgi:hypothetical protein